MILKFKKSIYILHLYNKFTIKNKKIKNNNKNKDKNKNKNKINICLLNIHFLQVYIQLDKY